MEPLEDAFVLALYRRVRHAVREADRAVARAHTLAAMHRVLGERLPVRRCAWCGRFSHGEEWMDEAELPRFVPKRAVDAATHTICPDCEARLVREGKSHARNGN